MIHSFAIYNHLVNGNIDSDLSDFGFLIMLNAGINPADMLIRLNALHAFTQAMSVI